MCNYSNTLIDKKIGMVIVYTSPLKLGEDLE